ncbi:zinc finger FYVE domain-containing protein 9-like [Macrosteles quadrilineatus]|uniref:zinc finger FYVE domain-containing protein 9-like n=1 Tax=Macrosteles quadrilineatus TaxID=74068 RepID=UPI0023E13E66|nr:zinc finger FYVE domain-containing protein 9-like [Macrosteles quadrilineatus]
MEKFAVDLEKVLDEFEYNEEREENISVASIRNSSHPALGLGALRQVPVVRPPAASYRRPSFEPINLADADFAASPPKTPSLNFNLGTSVTERQNADETFAFAGNRAQFNNRNYVTDNKLLSALNNEANIKNQLLSESEDETTKEWPQPHSSITNDEKPDLLEYNSKNIDFSTNNSEIHNQLPDITSVRSLDHESNNNQNENIASSLDLISSTSSQFAAEIKDVTLSSDTYESGKSKYTILRENHLSENGPQNIAQSYESVNVPENEEVNSVVLNPSVSDVSYEYSSLPLHSNITQVLNNVSENPELSNIVPSSSQEKVSASISYNDNRSIVVTTGENLGNVEVNVDSENIYSSKTDTAESLQPIGFNDYADVSEGELEEYLKDLEEMEETVDFKDLIVPEECLKIEITNNAENNQMSVEMKTGERGFPDYVPVESIKIKEQENIVKDDMTNVICDVPSKNVVEGKSSISERSKNDITEKCESPVYQSDDFDTSTSSTPLISENESTSEEVDKTQGKIFLSEVKSDESPVSEKITYVDVPTSKDNPEKISTNPFCNSNPFESSMSSSRESTKDVGGGTNPFDDEDSGYISEKMESKRKSTNPFEEDDDKNITASSISETEDPAKLENLKECLTLTVSKPKSKNENEKAKLNNSASSASHKDKSKITKEEIPTVEPVRKSSHTNGTDKSVSSNSETQVPAMLENLRMNECLTLEPKSKNKEKEKANINNSASSVSHKEKSKITKEEVPTVETVLEASHTDENTVNNTKELRVQNNSEKESLPSTSSSQENLPKTLGGSTKMIPIKTATESPSAENVDEAGVVAEEERPPRPNSLELPKKITVEAAEPQSPPLLSPPLSPPITGQLAREFGPEDRRLGKIPPFWVPDTDALSCMQCQQKFTVIKRRHHCRACGQVLCYKCCCNKARLEYMNFTEARVCHPCFTILEALNASEASSPLGRQPNPNNPMEYCSTIPPLQQVAGSLHQPPPSVMVPVGVLKREGRSRSEVTKQVMFSDGIRPGGDLTELDGSCEPRMPFRRPGRLTKRVGTPPGGVVSPSMRRVLDPSTLSFIPAEGDSNLPPMVSRVQGEITFSDLETPIALNQPNVKFAINRNLFVILKRVMLDCCVNRECWCFSTEGLACVGQDEIVFLLECLPEESQPPKDIFLLINNLYQEAAKGSTVSEMSFTPATPNMLGSKDHGGFLYIRTSYQCLTQLVLPNPPYLVALLINRWETPWARLFPLRLVLRLGAEFRYYPCPLVSVRNRPPLYTDIGHTIINILADFRKYSYTLPSVRGLVIHMEDRQTTINIPRNRYDQVVRALNNSNDSVLAFGANLSLAADSHLVCMQTAEDENTAYTTQAINIHNKPRKVTGASFVVFNGALKVPGLAGKSNIVEDGLMVQVPSETMTALRTALRDMRDYTIGCGPNAEETVALLWTADDTNFNIGVKSSIDGRPLDGVPSIRVHNGTDYSGGTRIIRWTEVFILQCDDSEHSSEPLDISRLSESIARATCLALVPLLDLLSAASFSTLAVRTTIHPDNVGYEAGSNGEKLPPLYMKSLDEELIAVVHQAALASQDNPCVLELVFRIMEQG